MSNIEKLFKYADRELGFASFFGILTLMIIFFTKNSGFFRIIGIVMGVITFALAGYSLVNVNKKRKILKNMEEIEKREAYKSHSKLYFVLNGIVFHEIIEKIDGKQALMGIDEIGIFTYLEDKKSDRQGNIPSTRIELNVEKLNITFKTLKYNRYLEGKGLELENIFREPESKYALSFDKQDNGFIFQRYK